ncbi:MAG: peptidoglycan-binding domain-containing protein [Candidatus Yanofskybacteria bacterium]|nr:peptidoglycan-binding domain-containing protein [Candidatus Yanofskybacteria bacterium]
MSRVFFATIFLFVFFTPVVAEAQFIGQSQEFFIDKQYDSQGRERTSATLLKISGRALIYVDSAWWEAQNPFPQNEARRALEALAAEFDGAIYPTLTRIFGSERKPGIDNNERITILFHPMKENGGGYTNHADGYSTLQVPASNMREMVYLNTDALGNDLLKSFLAHEFIHLITFNQKDILRNVSEDVWLNEARAEYAPTLMGYDSADAGNLKNRVQRFVRDPSTSLLEWTNTEKDYAVANLFAQYMVDHYKLDILVDSLQSPEVGVASLNYALVKNGYKKTFGEIFSDWVVAVLVNDCSLGTVYCYTNPLLENMRIVPQSNFLPTSGTSTLSLAGSAKDWNPAWYRVIGGNGALSVEFQGNPRARFAVPYVLEDFEGNLVVRSLEIDENQKGSIKIPNFSTYRSVTIIPFPQTNNQRTKNLPVYQFVVTLSTSLAPQIPGTPSSLTEGQIQAILSLLATFGADSSLIQNVGVALRGGFTAPPTPGSQGIPSDFTFMRNLQLGAIGEDVRYLQMLLNANAGTRVADTGPGAPGNETATFGPLTRSALIRFQELHAQEILAPWNLSQGTGIVGPTTREKLNALL